jgi:hypothetical protein
VEQRVDLLAEPDAVALFPAYETLADHVVHHRAQVAVIAAHVEKGAGVAMQAELGPGQHLEHLVHGAEAAGQGDEGVGQLVHARLALVHGVHHHQFAESLVRHLALDQLARDHADGLAAAGQHRVGDDAHQAHVAAAVDQGDAAPGHLGAEGARLFGVFGMLAGAGAAVDAKGGGLGHVEELVFRSSFRRRPEVFFNSRRLVIQFK